jgi:hypothetical protein
MSVESIRRVGYHKPNGSRWSKFIADPAGFKSVTASSPADTLTATGDTSAPGSNPASTDGHVDSAANRKPRGLAGKRAREDGPCM